MKTAKLSEALTKKRPTPVTLCSCVGRDGKPNIITLGWEMQTSIEPLMFAISVAYKRHSFRLLEEVGEFVLAWPPETMADSAMICGTKSGRDTDKFRETGLLALKPSKVKPPLIAGCFANFECKVVGKIDTGDHRIYVGHCLAAHVDERAKGSRLFMLRGSTLGGVEMKK